MEISTTILNGIKIGMTVKDLCNTLDIKYRTQVLPFCLSRDRENFKPLIAKEFWLSKLSKAGSLFYMQELLDDVQNRYHQQGLNEQDGVLGELA
tara:strand:+ start:133 stop:414 length:282 start_codon:yes stop_codon:yes gene_type:complete